MDRVPRKFHLDPHPHCFANYWVHCHKCIDEKDCRAETLYRLSLMLDKIC